LVVNLANCFYFRSSAGRTAVWLAKPAAQLVNPHAPGRGFASVFAPAAISAVSRDRTDSSTIHAASWPAMAPITAKTIRQATACPTVASTETDFTKHRTSIVEKAIVPKMPA
jgi:hypothetical protein